MKAKEKKGFTLVEVIVVLVILAILMAIAIPALTGYIDRANDRALLAEAKNIQTALIAHGSDSYGSNTKLDATFTSATDLGPIITAVNGLTGMNVTATQLSSVTYANNILTGFIYTNGKKVTFSSTADPQMTIS